MRYAKKPMTKKPKIMTRATPCTHTLLSFSTGLDRSSLLVVIDMYLPVDSDSEHRFHVAVHTNEIQRCAQCCTHTAVLTRCTRNERECGALEIFMGPKDGVHHG